MLKVFKMVSESEMAQKLGIFVVEDDEIGIYTLADAVSIKALIKVFNMTSNYNSNFEVSKRNLDKKDMIFSILKDAEREIKEITNEEIDITSFLVDEVMEVRKMIIGH